MKLFLIFIVGAVFGGAVALFLLPAIFVGMGAGAGVATGLKAGTCLTAEAAKEKGFITAGQVGELISAAGQQISAQKLASDDVSLASGDAKCQEFLARLKKATTGSR